LHPKTLPQYLHTDFRSLATAHIRRLRGKFYIFQYSPLGPGKESENRTQKSHIYIHEIVAKAAKAKTHINKWNSYCVTQCNSGLHPQTQPIIVKINLLGDVALVSPKVLKMILDFLLHLDDQIQEK
jgi:hypothetical protein